MNDDETIIARLYRSRPGTGQLEWIGLRPASRAPMIAVESVEARAGCGLAGDRYARDDSGGSRQVTFIQAEHLPVIARLCGTAEVTPELLRRNLVVSGINLLALLHRRFTVGATVLEGVKPCTPCSRMEQALGPGGYKAMIGHGGITARILEGGVIRLGDTVRAEPV